MAPRKSSRGLTMKLDFKIADQCFLAFGASNRRYEVGEWSGGIWCLTGCLPTQRHDALASAFAAAQAHEDATK